MKIAVCVKYVPVVSRIQFDYENKVIQREGVPSEINPFDLLGINMAVDLKDGDADSVIALSMGPPNAAEGLTQCYALGADRAVLLSDRALAGSDTLATAQALSLALQRESPDLIVCGRNSSDAETGQVGPEVAELMGLPHISNVRKLEIDRAANRISVERATDEGYQVLECDLPAVVCVTEGAGQERYPGREEMAEAETKTVEQLTCADLTDDLSLFGLEGSPTWVEDIRLVEPDRLGVVIRDETPEEAARQIAEHLRERLASLAADAGEDTDDAELPHHDGGDRPIWVVTELARNSDGILGVRQVTLEMLGKARALTPVTQSEVVAVVISDSIGEPANSAGLLRQLVKGGADRVLTLDTTGLGPVCGRGVADSLSGAIAADPPYAVLFAATADGRDLAARIAARLRLGLTGDAIDLEINDAGQLVQLKPALGGNVVAPILSKTLPNLVTLRPGVLTPAAPEDGARDARVDEITPAASSGADVTLVSEHFSEEHGALELTSAEVVVGVGMGVTEEGVPTAQQLASTIGASICTTRNVVHSGWLPHHIQVGISGRTIAPQVYLAVGIRGAFNHTVGIQKAGVILAINRNHRAAIFRAADYGIVGDWNEYLPAVVKAIKPVLAEHGLA
ncbi:MAG: FAD-binding protein [Chloroflexota bacterium]|nr:FAD-binding protein [Chloroflexota bacterium]MDE2683457.1 FAD-binding protein [Chloroflexota bacterium]